MSAILVNDRMNLNSVNIPAVFFAEHMPRANGEYVKVYLYLVYMVQSNRTISISMLAEALEDTEKDVMRALRYWQKHGVINLAYDGENALTSIELLPMQGTADQNSSAQNSQQPETEKRQYNQEEVQQGQKLRVSEEPVVQEHRIQEGKSQVHQKPETDQNSREAVRTGSGEKSASADSGEYTPVYENHDSLEELTGNEEFVELMFVIQQYKGSPLSTTELQKIAFFYNIFGHLDVVEYLFEYCLSNNHRQMRYIEKTALNWHKEGIRTRKDAEEAQRRMRNGDYARQVMERFGLKTEPAPLQDNYIRKWRDTYHFTIDMVLAACDRTVKRCGGHNFEYADRILTGWYEAKLFTQENVANYEKERQERKQAEAAVAATADFNRSSQPAAGESGKAAASGGTGAVSGTRNHAHTVPARKNAFHNFSQRDYSNVDLDSMVFGIAPK